MNITNSISSIGDRNTTVTSFTSPFASIDGAGFADLLAAVTPTSKAIEPLEQTDRETYDVVESPDSITTEERESREPDEASEGQDSSERVDGEPLAQASQTQESQTEIALAYEDPAIVDGEGNVELGLDVESILPEEVLEVDSETAINISDSGVVPLSDDSQLVDQSVPSEVLSSQTDGAGALAEIQVAVAATSESEKRKSTDDFALTNVTGSKRSEVATGDTIEAQSHAQAVDAPEAEVPAGAQEVESGDDGSSEKKGDAKYGENQRSPSLDSLLRRGSEASQSGFDVDQLTAAKKLDSGSLSELPNVRSVDPIQSQANSGSNGESTTPTLGNVAALSKSSSLGTSASEASTTRDPSVGSLSGPSSPTNTARPDGSVAGKESGQSPISQIKLIQRVSRAFQHLGPDGGTIRLRLAPAELGTVRIEMAVSQNKIEARVVAETEAAESLLREHLGTLRSRLESQGMTIEKLEIAKEGDAQDSDNSSFSNESAFSDGQAEERETRRRSSSLEGQGIGRRVSDNTKHEQQPAPVSVGSPLANGNDWRM